MITHEQLDKMTPVAETQRDNSKVNPADASMGELSPLKQKKLLEALNKHNDVFAINPKRASACAGAPMRLKFKQPNCVPYVAPTQHYNLEQRYTILDDVVKLLRDDYIRESCLK